MSNNEWVQEGTPRDADDWSEDQNDYGVPVEPWDDYSSEQGVPVPPPAAPGQPEAAAASSDADAQASDGETQGEVAEQLVTPTPEVDPFARPVEAADVEEPVLQAPTAPELEPAPPEPEPEPALPEPEPVVPEPEPALPESEPVVSEPAQPDPYAAAEEEQAEAEPPVEVPVFAAGVAPAGEAVDEPQIDEPVVAEPSEELTETRQRPVAVDVHAEAATETAPEVIEPLPAAEPAAAATTSLAGLYREDEDRTQVLDTTGLTAEEDAEERLAEQRRLEKEARDQRLGLVATSDANAVRDTLPPARPGVNGFASLGLFIFRVVVAGILAVAAMQILTPVSATADFLSQTRVPYATEVAWGLGIALALMAVLLVLGLGVRVIGLVLTAICAASLAFLRWGPFPIFVSGQEGFIGDKDLLLAAAGILLFCIGGGKAGIDGAISKARWNAKLAKRS